MQLRKTRQIERKADSRKKIELGGLIIKAGLDYLHPKQAYVLYGMLLDCKRLIGQKPELKARWGELGKGLLIRVNIAENDDGNKTG